jgi:solute carrier family 25 2-oxodicarboxylate transporter 21
MTDAGKRLSPDRLALAGSIAGWVECLAVQPLDNVKTRFQLQTAAGPSQSVAQGIRSLIAEGGVGRLYRGMLPELLAITPKSMAMYSSYEFARRWFSNVFSSSGKPANGVLVAAAAGGVSGVPEAFVLTPFHVVKTRLQAKEHLGRYHNSWQCLSTVVKEEGVIALSNGFMATACRNAMWNSVYFSSMFVLKANFNSPPPPASADGGDHFNGPQALFTTLWTGFAGGVLATCFNCPFDVIKSRVQADANLSQSAPQGVVQRLLEIQRLEGTRALWKGFNAKALKMGLGGSVGMAAFEVTASLLAPPVER